jgi:hypothetical protein
LGGRFWDHFDNAVMQFASAKRPAFDDRSSAQLTAWPSAAAA